MRRKSYRSSLSGSPAPVVMSPAPEQSSPGLSLAPGLSIPLRYANRHGLITGQTGTGKSVTLMRLAECFTDAGTAVFLADVKGDLARMANVRPVQFLDAYGTGAERFTAGPADLGADLFARALNLSDAQAGTLELAYHLAAREGRPLEVAGDLMSLLGDMIARRDEINATLGQVSPASVGVIRRALLRLDPNVISGPSFDVANLLGAGRLTMLRAEKLMHSPRLYAALLMYVLDQLDKRLPEVGDLPAPRLAFFFDEAHLLFADVPPALLLRIERTVRLIRSKGVGVYFASQRPDDIPANVRDQLAHRVEHGRAYGVGRARVETLNGDGSPRPMGAPVSIHPPACLAAPEPELSDSTDTAGPHLLGSVRPEPLPPPAPRPVPAPERQAGAPESGIPALLLALAVLILALVGGLALVGVPPLWTLATVAGLALAPLMSFGRHRH